MSKQFNPFGFGKFRYTSLLDKGSITHCDMKLKMHREALVL